MAKTTVLVADDETPLLKLMATALEHDGLSVATAHDGAEAIECLSKNEYRVVLLDLMMPRVNGWDVIKWLKAHPDRRPYSLVVVTAADRNVFADLDPEIVNAIIIKPFDTWELTGYVKRCCEDDRHDRRSRRVVSLS
ncbi:MAG TPA: response regulator [Thermoanaerobaculia bacterium]|jgi:CheY-like chemotaxis protein|nr:response regulator [Thermoanaerobaculia bacterium]